MKVQLTEDEVQDITVPSHYPDCFSDCHSFNLFFIWAITRQGHTYWRDKFENEIWWDYLNDPVLHTQLNTMLVKNLSYSDRVYMSLIAFHRKHGITSYEFSIRAGRSVSF